VSNKIIQIFWKKIQITRIEKDIQQAIAVVNEEQKKLEEQIAINFS
jgi:hypothetical protein